MKWKQPHEFVATLFYGLVKNHPFHDGNKRTALLVALYQIVSNGRIPEAPHAEFENLVIRTAANRLHEYRPFSRFAKRYSDESDSRVYFLADFFRRKTRKSDHRYYAFTYNELETLLPSFGYRFDNPSKNYVDIVRDDEVSTGFLGLGRKKTVTKKITQIGYPGGTREVGKGAIATIRRACGLTADNGIDSQVFFKDADPLSSLIAQYHGPLTRLKDK